MDLLLPHHSSIVRINCAQEVDIVVRVETHDVFIVDKLRLLDITQNDHTNKNVHLFAQVVSEQQVMHDSHTMRLHSIVQKESILSNNDVFRNYNSQSLLHDKKKRKTKTIIVVSHSSLL